MEQLGIDLRSIEVALLEHPDKNCLQASNDRPTANVSFRYEQEMKILRSQVDLILDLFFLGYLS